MIGQFWTNRKDRQWHFNSQNNYPKAPFWQAPDMHGNWKIKTPLFISLFFLKIMKKVWLGWSSQWRNSLAGKDLLVMIMIMIVMTLIVKIIKTLQLFWLSCWHWKWKWWGLSSIWWKGRWSLWWSWWHLESNQCHGWATELHLERTTLPHNSWTISRSYIL